jgi:hypothetical protein
MIVDACTASGIDAVARRQDEQAIIVEIGGPTHKSRSALHRVTRINDEPTLHWSSTVRLTSAGGGNDLGLP